MSGIPNIIDCGICSLHPVQPSNVWVVEQLFQSEDVDKYYVRRADHKQNIHAFCNYLVAANLQQAAMNFIIYSNYGEEVGLITAEAVMNRKTNLPMWNVGYAILPEERSKGYATSAVNGLTNFLLGNFSIPQVMLDISMDNKASESVAMKCGFEIPDRREGYIDQEHLEVGMRHRWFKQLVGQRAVYFNQAVHQYRQKAYAEAIQSFHKALSEPYQPGTPYTDAQIYSNIGMALSSCGFYQDAFNALKKAQALGLSNASIEKELLWLRNNKGLY